MLPMSTVMIGEARHADDDTPCTSPVECSLVRLVYWPGGATLTECDED